MSSLYLVLATRLCVSFPKHLHAMHRHCTGLQGTAYNGPLHSICTMKLPTPQTCVASGRIPIKLLTAAPELVRREAQIVAAAGMPGSVTLATNMAGDACVPLDRYFRHAIIYSLDWHFHHRHQGEAISAH